MWKRFISVLLLFCFSWCLFSEAPQSSIQSGLTSLENFVVNFENESLTQKILIDSLQNQLNEANQSVTSLETQLAEASQLQEQQSNLLKKYEFKCKVLKWSLVVSTGIAITTVSTLIVVCNADKWCKYLIQS